MSSSKEGIRKYEKQIKKYCNVSSTYNLSKEDRDSCFGIAMVLAYRDGVNPSKKSFSDHLKLSPYLLEDAYERLKVNGIFGPVYDINEDDVLMGRQKNTNKYLSKKRMTENAWCYIGGISAGFLGVK